MAEMSKESLIAFEKEIEEIYMAGKIKSPIHFSGGNEEALIALFKDISKEDWVFATYRSHYHALLKGIDKNWLKEEIIANRSIHIMNKEHKVVTSAIVAGTLPIAVGAALAIKLKNSNNKVWAFCGDMAAETGMFHECTKFSRRNGLPIKFVVEDNTLSVDTPTQECWGTRDSGPNVLRYEYKRIYPHYGCGKWVAF
jgi:pyruvate dehydrogenase E1 component alpha subunit